MTYTITQFGNDTTPALPDLDQNFQAFGVLAPVPCVISGTNTLTFAQNSGSTASSVSMLDYQNYQQVCGVASATNTGPVTARVGALAAPNVYKDTQAGPAQLVGGEIVLGCAFTLLYDSTLNSNAGGWHLHSSISSSGGTISPALVRASTGLQVGATTTPTLTGLLSAAATLAYTAIVPNSAQDQTFTVAGLLRTDGLAMALPLPNSLGLTFTSYFAAGDPTIGTVTVRAANLTASSTITPGTVTVGLKALRST